MNTKVENHGIRVLIVDDHFMTRLGLAVPIGQESDMEVVGEVGTVEDAIAAYRKHVPDITIMDYRLPDGDGAEATQGIRSEFPGARILILSAVEKDAPIQKAVGSGVCGFLSKDSSCQDVLEAIRQIHSGGTVFPDSIKESIERTRQRKELSDREISILKLVAAGRSNKEIAHEFRLSESTIKQELGKILKKLGAPDRTRAATLAIEIGIIEND